jgi:hypothetical protein
LGDDLSAMALCESSFSRQFFELFPFIGQFLGQFSVDRFRAPFEPSNPSVAPMPLKQAIQKGVFGG